MERVTKWDETETEMGRRDTGRLQDNANKVFTYLSGFLAGSVIIILLFICKMVIIITPTSQYGSED